MNDIYIYSTSSDHYPMLQTVDINNRKELRRLLLALDPETIPLWGKMKPRQMIEHLVSQVQWTNGKKIAIFERPAEAAARSKQKMVYTDAYLLQNIVIDTLP
jgi:hypothetical protein